MQIRDDPGRPRPELIDALHCVFFAGKYSHAAAAGAAATVDITTSINSSAGDWEKKKKRKSSSAMSLPTFSV